MSMSHRPARSLMAAAVLAACLGASVPALAAAPGASLFASAQRVSGNAPGEYLVEVKLNAATLQAAKRGQVMDLALPGIGSFQVVFDGSLPKGEGTQWLGHLKDGVQYSVVLLTTMDGVTGDIRTPKGAFRLGHANGKEWLARQGVAGADSARLAALPSMFSVAATDSAAASGKSRGKAPAAVAYPVHFNLVAMANLKPGDEVSLPIPGMGSYPVVYEATRANDSGSSTWVGYLKDYGDDFRVIITTSAAGSLGNILTPSGELELTTVSDSQWLIDRSASGLTTLHPDHTDGVPPTIAQAGGGGLPGVAMGGTTTAPAAPATVTVANAGTTTTATQIDVLVIYTPGFVTRLGANWRTRIDQLVALTNQSYIDSGVPQQIRLVGVEQVNYADTTTNSTALSLLTSSSGAFSTVAGLRKKYGADLVTLMRPFYMNAQGQNCGVGYISGYGGSNVAAYSSYGFSVVSDGKDTAGTNYYCTDYTFTHELGHNMGSMHDRTTVASQGGGTGAYPYSFGYGRSGSFGTIMSYISPVVGKFSNPRLSTCGGTQACGVATTASNSADNATSLSNTAKAVSGFQATVVPATVQITGLVSKGTTAVAGVSFTPSGTDGTCTTSAANGTYACTVPLNWSGTIKPKLTGATFTPATLGYPTLLLTSQTNQNFVKN